MRHPSPHLPHRLARHLACIGLIALPACAWAQSSFAPGMAEYSSSTTVTQLRIRGVHSRGILGAGVKVALLDTGLDLSNPEFYNNSRVLTPYNVVDGSSDVTDSIHHGTHVAGIIAASGNGRGMYGVAPMADLLMIKVFNGGTASATHINNGLDYAIAQGARVVNMSFGTTTPLGDTALRRAAATNQAVLVVAAGNEGTRNPNWPGRYARESWAGGTMLVVGAVDNNNRLASFSNRAGDTAQFYLVAPGVNIFSAYGSGYGYMSGTSMAAPAVSGAAALVTGYWPYLRASQVAAILLNTADDLGAPGVDAVYGHGLLNVNRALSPVGSYTYRSASGYKVTVPLSVLGLASRQPAVVTPSAFQGLQTEVFDAYGRNFTSDEGASLAVRSVLTSEMVMGPAADATAVSQRVAMDGSRLTLWQAATLPAGTLHAAANGVMSPLSAGLSPTQAWGGSATNAPGALRWDNGRGWGLSLGSGGLSGVGLGLAANALPDTSLDDNAGGTPPVASTALPQLTASPLAGFAPAHRFAVLSMPLGGARSAAGGLWRARQAARQPARRARPRQHGRAERGHARAGPQRQPGPAGRTRPAGRLQQPSPGPGRRTPHPGPEPERRLAPEPALGGHRIVEPDPHRRTQRQRHADVGQRHPRQRAWPGPERPPAAARRRPVQPGLAAAAESPQWPAELQRGDRRGRRRPARVRPADREPGERPARVAGRCALPMAQQLKRLVDGRHDPARAP